MVIAHFFGKFLGNNYPNNLCQNSPNKLNHFYLLKGMTKKLQNYAFFQLPFEFTVQKVRIFPVLEIYQSGNL